MTGNTGKGSNGGSSAGHYTGGAGAGTSRESGFISASPESNVGPPGAPQTSHGSAGIPEGGAERKGAMGGSAGGGKPGTSAGGAGQGSQGAAGGSIGGGKADPEHEPGSPGGSLGADSR
jgi:hypothetical protein